MGERDQQTQSIKFNNQEYNVSVTLINGRTDFPLPLGIIKEIHIVDSIYSIYRSTIEESNYRTGL